MTSLRRLGNITANKTASQAQAGGRAQNTKNARLSSLTAKSAAITLAVAGAWLAIGAAPALAGAPPGPWFAGLAVRLVCAVGGRPAAGGAACGW